MIAFLEQVLGYYKSDASRDFLSYGQFMRPLKFSQPAEMPIMVYSRGGKFRALWNGVFRDAEGNLGVFIANASRQELPFESTMVLDRHGMTGAAAAIGQGFRAMDALRDRGIQRHQDVISKLHENSDILANLRKVPAMVQPHYP